MGAPAPGDAKSVRVIRVPLGFAQAVADGSFSAEYRLDLQVGELAPAAVLVQVRAENGTITSAGAAPLLLDAEFTGTQVDPDLLVKVWEIDQRRLPRDLWDAMVDTGNTLPQSGDGAEGGLLHSWFEFVRAQ